MMTQVDQKKNRDSNLELYRILVMLFIVAHHYVVNSGLRNLMDDAPMSPNSIYFSLFGMWGKIGINCFVLITGYYMCTSKITIRKFWKLLMEVAFYNVMISCFFFVIGYTPFSILLFLKSFWPIWNMEGFIVCFLLFYLMIPFLNILVRNMTKQQHAALLALLLVIFSVLPSMPMVVDVMNNYVVWFCVLFILSSYIRLYNPIWAMRLGSLGGVILLVSLAIASVVLMQYVSYKEGRPLYNYAFVADSNKILAVMVSIGLFVFFKNIKMSYNRVINTIASSTFGVLCIHANCDEMRQWLWKDVIDCIGHYNTIYYPVYAIGSVLTIFVVCVIIDQIRINTVEKCFFYLYDRIVNPISIAKNVEYEES